MPNRQAQCQRAWRQSRQVATLLQACNTSSSHYAGGILTLVLTSFNPPHLNFMVYWLILLRKSGQCGFTACPDGRLHHLGNSPAFRWAKVMGRLFFLESYCVTQPLTPSQASSTALLRPVLQNLYFRVGPLLAPDARGWILNGGLFYVRRSHSHRLPPERIRITELRLPPDLQAIFIFNLLT